MVFSRSTMNVMSNIGQDISFPDNLIPILAKSLFVRHWGDNDLSVTSVSSDSVGIRMQQSRFKRLSWGQIWRESSVSLMIIDVYTMRTSFDDWWISGGMKWLNDTATLSSQWKCLWVRENHLMLSGLFPDPNNSFSLLPISSEGCNFPLREY